MTVTALRRPSRFAGFTTIWFGQLLSAVGTRMTNFALSIWVWEATGRATDFVMLTFCAFTATVVFSPVAGALIDRWSRRLTIVLSDVGSAVATLAVLVLFTTHSVSMWQLYAVNAATGAFLAFQGPAYSATITVMVERGAYPRANAMMFAVRSVPVIFAPGLAAALLAHTDIRVVLLIDVLSYLAAIGVTLLVTLPPIPASGEAGPASLWQDALYGFRYLRARRPLAFLEAIMFSINLFASVGFLLLIPLILARTGNDEAQVGLVQTLAAIGGVTGAVLLGTLPRTPHKMRRVLVSIMVFSLVGRVLYGVGQNWVAWAVALLVVHLCIPFIDGYAQTLFQEKVVPHAQGRVMAARQFVEDLTIPLAALIAGPLVDRVLEPWMRPGHTGARLFADLVGTGPGAGIGLMYVIVGLLGAAVAVIGFAVPDIRRIESILPDVDLEPPPGRRQPSERPDGSRTAPRPEGAGPALEPAPVEP
ncbi:MAG: MFS transporter [Actinobacteria bacterium]|nr:MFS transporter [Actinomycetota bacterium]